MILQHSFKKIFLKYNIMILKTICSNIELLHQIFDNMQHNTSLILSYLQDCINIIFDAERNQGTNEPIIFRNKIIHILNEIQVIVQQSFYDCFHTLTDYNKTFNIHLPIGFKEMNNFSLIVSFLP